MGGVHKAAQPQQNSGLSISIAMSLSNGLGVPGFPGAGAQAFAGPNGAFAQAGGPGGLGSFCPACGGPNANALAGNFGGPQGPQNPFQAGFQQGMMAGKMKKLMRKMRKLMHQMQQLSGGAGLGGPGFGPSPFGAPGGAFASAGPGGAYASAGGFGVGAPRLL